MSLTQQQREAVERLADSDVDGWAAADQLREAYGDIDVFEAARLFDSRRDARRTAEAVRVGEVRP